MPRSWGVVLLVALAFWALFGVFAGRALGNHVACGDVVTQDTTLDSDLIDCPGDGIVVAADDVTLDLRGHTVAGPGTGSGIRAVGHHGLTVQHGVIRGFWVGLDLDSVAATRTRGLAIRSNGIGLRLVGAGNRIAANEIRDNVTGADLRGAGNRFVRNVVSADLFSGPPTFAPAPIGVRVVGSSSPEVSGSLVSGYYRSIELDRVTGAHVAGNVLTPGEKLAAGAGEPMLGIYAHAGSVNFLRRNVVSGTTNGIYVSEPGTRIEWNAAVGNRRGMMITREASDIAIRHNLAADSLEEGIDTNALRTLLERNVAARNRSGIVTRGIASGSVLKGNLATSNRIHGIEAGTGTTVTRNLAYRNGDLGIFGEEGVIDGGGNRAFGNGNPVQCLNVACR